MLRIAHPIYALAALGINCFAASTTALAASLNFVENTPSDYEYARHTAIPGTFGAGEFTLEIWIRPDHTYPVGPTTFGTPGQLINWTSSDATPYSSSSWWFEGNFLLDGHNNSGTFSNGTFSIQFYGGGRVRWDFGDGATPTGGTWAIQASPATTTPTLLDGNWHSVACVRRWSGASSATLELWIDGVLIDAETSNLRTNMRTAYWNSWTGFPSGQSGWFWGVEKQAAIGANGVTQYEDYKGLLDEVRFWSRAKTSQELANDWDASIVGNETGLDGWYRFDEGTGTSTCNEQTGGECWSLLNSSSANWSAIDAPLLDPTDPNYIYLDFAAPDGGNGTQAAPFNTLDDAVSAADPGATIEIAPGATPEIGTVTKALTVINGNSGGGTVQLGNTSSRLISGANARTGFVAHPPR